MHLHNLGVLPLSFVLLTGQSQHPVSTGRFLTPASPAVQTGDFPVNIEVSPDGKLAAVLHSGISHSIVILDLKSGKILDRRTFDGPTADGKAKEGLYFGLRFFQKSDGALKLYVSQGASDKVEAFEVSKQGQIGATIGTWTSTRPFFGPLMPHFMAGLEVSSDGSRIYAVGNQSFALSSFEGSLSIFDAESPKVKKVIPLPGFPLDALLLKKGANKDRKLYVSCERDGIVAVVDTSTLSVIKKIQVGAHPGYMTFDSKQDRLFVSCSLSDQVTVIDTALDEPVGTLLLRPAEQRGLPGGNPLGISISKDDRFLYAAMSDLNAAAVYDLKNMKLSGFIPTGWYPTDVAAVNDEIWVASAKGRAARNPNIPPNLQDKEAVINGDSGPNIRGALKGELMKVSGASRPSRLKSWTRKVIENNLFQRIEKPLEPASKPEIKNVIYIVKENRTYDQFFGDFPEGNGRPDMLLYDDSVIPNQRALARRFTLMDNFYACAEMSADGWSWSVAGITGPYVQRNAQYGYSGRKREYDYEGQTNGTPTDANGIKNVNNPPGGYIWDNALRHGLEFRNYGIYIAQGVPIRDKEGKPIAEDNTPAMKAFGGRWDNNFRMYDLEFPDSDIWEKLGKSYPKQRKTWGPMQAKSRTEAWLANYEKLIRSGTVPPLMLIRLGNDHTSGTAPGFPTPRAMIADNDYAVGQIVEAVSKGPLWKSTAIVIIEDDAQGGYDHVDGHRSVCWVVSPWVKRSQVIKDFHNTDSALRTVEWLLGMKPTNQFMATARVIDCFDSGPSNAEPFTALMPNPEIMTHNTEASYRAADSARLFHTYREESAPDRELADILWGDAKGADTPRPRLGVGPVKR